jgi:hypothetical protein
MNGDVSDERRGTSGAATHPEPGAPELRDPRRERLAAALRENLKRRKAQARSRREGEET